MPKKLNDLHQQHVEKKNDAMHHSTRHDAHDETIRKTRSYMSRLRSLDSSGQTLLVSKKRIANTQHKGKTRKRVKYVLAAKEVKKTTKTTLLLNSIRKRINPTLSSPINEALRIKMYRQWISSSRVNVNNLREIERLVESCIEIISNTDKDDGFPIEAQPMAIQHIEMLRNLIREIKHIIATRGLHNQKILSSLAIDEEVGSSAFAESIAHKEAIVNLLGICSNLKMNLLAKHHHSVGPALRAARNVKYDLSKFTS